MSQEVEKEFKNLLTEQEYRTFVDHWNLTEHTAINQENFYYDTEDFQLAKRGMGLRIRVFEQDAEQTLKTPLGENEKIESTDPLTFLEANELRTKQQLKPGGFVEKELSKAGVPFSELQEIGSLRTIRYEIPAEKGTFFLDKSFYRDQVDYEIEYEAADTLEGLQFFQTFVQEWSIPLRPTPNKIQRAVQTRF